MDTLVMAERQPRREPPCARRYALLLFAALFAAAAVLGPPTAQAKEFLPGDLRVCNAHRCLPITAPSTLRQLSAFYYGDAPPALAPAPRIGTIAFELRFSNGYVTGIVASARLNRFLSYGVNLGRFSPGQWYRLPASTAHALQRLSAPLAPLRLTQAAERRSD